MIAAPLFHSWGFMHFILSLPLGSTMVLRRRFDPEETLQAIAAHEAEGARGGAGDDAADPRPARRGAARYDLPSLRVTGASGSALPGDLADEVDGHVRRQPLQPLRLDRGRLGDDRDARGHARGARHRGARPPGHRGQDPRRGRQGSCRRARPDGSSSATRCPSRATPEAATRSVSTGLLSSGDVGPLRRGGPPVHRRPRRRDDRLRRRERLPARGRGPARRPRGGRRGRRDRRRGRGVRPAAACLRRRSGGRGVDEDELKDHVKANLARYKVPREIVFLDELPRNATGKVLKRELAEEADEAEEEVAD